MRNDIGECVSVRRVFTLENCDISMFLLAIFVCCSCQLVDFECILYSALCSSFFPLLLSRMDVYIFRRSTGYLVYLEGLITTAGKELGMMQDVDSVVELLKEWTICILPLADGVRPSADDGAASADDNSSSGARGVVDVCANPEAKELHVLMDVASFQRLPTCLQAPDLAIKLVPVLFVQGVDIKQSLSNRSGEKEGSGPRFQMSLNRKYFQLVRSM